MSGKSRAAIRARERARAALVSRVVVAEPVKTKADLQGELDAAGIEYPKNARKADLEALLPASGLGSITTQDIA